MRNYPVGKSHEGNEAYLPLLLLKCLLLAQWFRIDSDPELEAQINGRISLRSSWKSLSINLPLIIPPSPAPEPDSRRMS